MCWEILYVPGTLGWLACLWLISVLLCRLVIFVISQELVVLVIHSKMFYHFILFNLKSILFFLFVCFFSLCVLIFHSKPETNLRNSLQMLHLMPLVCFIPRCKIAKHCHNASLSYFFSPLNRTTATTLCDLR